MLNAAKSGARAFAVLGLLVAIAACSGEGQPRSTPVPVDESQFQSPITQVLVLGMIHSGHKESAQWGLEQVAETIRRIQPDVVCAEIPPLRWPAVWAEYRAAGTVSDSRVLRFPEYTDVLLPLKMEMGFEVVGCAAWTQEMSDARSQKLKALAVEPELAALNAEYELRSRAVESRHAAEPIEDGDPRVIHSQIYDERTRASLLPYDELLNDYLGSGGWTNINRSHWALVGKAIDDHHGQRILITFGAGHKYWLLDRLMKREDVQLLDVVPYLP